jgi:uncharacterized protein YecE (DUF72 family)
MQDHFIGCSGYYYPAWKNKFYPQGLAPKQWLQHYSTVFNSVEMNGTFYRQPKPSDLKKYYDATPPDFRFSVKMSRYITHVMKLKDARKVIDEFQDLILNVLQEKLACFLFQMPPGFQFNSETLDHVTGNIPHAPHNVVEFRHLSWWNAATEAMVRSTDITFCNIDFPGLQSYLIYSRERFYMRFHGNPTLFKSSYSTEALEDYADKFPRDVPCYIYFNNTATEAGYSNALELKKLLHDA